MKTFVYMNLYSLHICNDFTLVVIIMLIL